MTLFFLVNKIVLFAGHKEIVFKQLSIEQGLPGVNVRSIFQDSYGYMWFGIESAGLCKYDGKRFYTYDTDIKDTDEISNSFINSIIEDENGDLWLATENGLNIFDRQKEIFKKYYFPEISNSYINSIYKDKNNAIWIGTFSGFMRFKPVSTLNKEDSFVFGHENRKIKYIVDKDVYIKELQDRRVNCIFEDDNNIFWFGTIAGVYNYNYNTKQINHWKAESNKDDNPSINRVNNIKKLYDDYYLLSTEGGLVLYNNSSGSYNILAFKQSGMYPDAELAISSVFFDSKGVMWFGTVSQGLITGTVSNMPDNIPVEINTPNTVEGILSPNIKGIYEDKTGQIWIITKFAGIFTYDSRSQVFPHYLTGSKDDNFIISAFERRNGNILLGSKYSGLFEFNRKEKSFSQKKSFINDPLERRIESVFEDKEGNLWLGLQKGLVKMDASKNVLSYYKHEKVWTFLEDKSGTLWLGTIRGILVLNKRTNKLEKKKDFPSNHFFNNSHISVVAMLEDSKGNIWFGTNSNGIYRYNELSDKTDSFRFEPGNNYSLSDNTIRSIYEDSQGTIWVGTKSSGLNRFLGESGGFKHFTTAAGLPSNTIFSIVEDDTGNLWLITNNGVSKYDIKNNKFTNFNAKHGLQGNVFEPRTTVKLNNGDILFAGNNGFNIFSPGKVDLDYYNPQLVVTNITANGQSIKKDVFENIGLVLPYNQSKLITLEFASLDYRDPASLKYAYQLEGIDDDWIYSGKRNIVTYTRLSHGKYNFKFKATNADGIWADKEFNIRLILQTPWWLKWWAYAIYTVLIAALFYVIYKAISVRAVYNHRLQIKEIELKKNEELNQTKLRFFTNITHELRTPLSLIIAPIQKLLNSDELSDSFKQKIKLVERSVKRLMRLTDQLLYFRKAQQANMQLQLVHSDIVRFIAEIITPFYELADIYSLQLEFSSSPHEQFIWFDPDKVEKIISNLLSNAFKFTPKYGFIKLQVQAVESIVHTRKSFFSLKKNNTGNFVKISIADSGIGMKEQQIEHIIDRFYQAETNNTGLGIGLELVKQLVNMHKGKIDVKSALGKGTTFSIYLPVNKYVYKEEIFTDREINTSDYVKKVEPAILYPLEEKVIDPDEFKREVVDKPFLLIVEDNLDLSSYLKQILTKRYKVIIAPNGKEALQIIKTKVPDIIITDLMMPEMNGIELCNEVKNNIQTSHIPVIIISAKGLEEDQLQGLKTGADDYITKPFNIDILEVRIKNLIDSRRKLHKQFSNSVNINPKEVASNKIDQQFMTDFLSIINDNIDNPNLSIIDISRQLRMDRTNLFKKIKNLVGKSPSQIVREYRIKNAAKLLLTNNHNINEISFMTGFTSHAYFTKLFHKIIGKTPTEFIRDTQSSGTGGV